MKTRARSETPPVLVAARIVALAGLIVTFAVAAGATSAGAATPVLRIDRAAALEVVLSWPVADGDGFVLQSADALGSSADWQAVAATPAVGDGRSRVTQPIGERARFYRLATTGSDAPPPVVLEARSATVGPSGGSLVLTEGGQLTIPAGALPAPTELTLRSLSDPVALYSPGCRIYEILGAGGATKALTLAFPGAQGRLLEELGVLLIDTTAGQSTAPPFTYDPASGQVTVTVKAGGAQLAGARPHGSVTQRLRLIFEWEAKHEPEHEEQLIPMPFYYQLGGSCWGSDAAMLVRAYRTDLPLDPPLLASVLRESRAPDNDFGGSVWSLPNMLTSYLAGATPSEAAWRGYVNTRFLKSRILHELDAGHPVILRVPGNTFKEKPGENEMGGHVMLVVGYRLPLEGGPLSLILHDSKDTFPVSFGEGMMCTLRDFTWVPQLRLVPWEVFQIFWLTSPPPPNRTLQTLSFPGAESKGGEEGATVHFIGDPPRPGRPVLVLAFPQLKPSVYPGYRWLSLLNLEPTNSVPVQCRSLDLQLRAWNAAPQPARVKVRVRVLTGATLVLAESLSGETVLPAAVLDNAVNKTGVTVSSSLLATEFRRIDLGSEDGRLPLTVEAVLLDEEGHFLDGWQMSGIALSVTPVLDSLGPCLGKIGDTISVFGIGFGQTKPASAGVWFNGAYATEYVSWNDRSIRVKVPPGATSGDVVVATRPESVYRTKGKPFTVVEKLPYPRITALSGTYKTSTWLFEHTVRWTGGTPPFTVKWMLGDMVFDEQVTLEYRRTVLFTAGQIGEGYRPGEGYVVQVTLRDALGEEPRIHGDVTSFLIIWDLDTMATSITVPGGFPYPEPVCPNP